MSDFEKALHEMFDHIWDCEIDHPMFQDTVGELMQAVLQAYDNIEPKQEWIPCTEGLPEEHEWLGTKMFGTTISDEVCITFDKNGERFVEVMSLQNGELSNSDKQSMDVFHKGWKMLAWKPLPKPWEGADDE